MKGSSVEGVKMSKHLYVDWCWLGKRSLDKTFFDKLNQALNDDCILQIIGYLDPLHMIFFGTLAERFQSLLKMKLTKLRICPSTVGTIGIMNLRYLLHVYGDSLKSLYISIHSFRPIFGFYPPDLKKDVLLTICHFSGRNLKHLYLHGFNSIDCNCNDLLIRRSIRVEVEVDPESIPAMRIAL